MSELLTTAQAARLLSAGPSTVKRWADTGLIDCIRTAGGHRRFARETLQRFQKLRELGEDEADEVQQWMDMLVSDSSHELMLVRARRRATSWYRVGEELTTALRELRYRWAQGDSTFVEQRTATERLSRALAAIADSLYVGENAPRALLASVEGESEALPLYVAEVCLRESGWGSVWLGAATPAKSVARAVLSDARIRLVLLNASDTCQGREQLREVYSSIGKLCQKRGVGLALVGDGAWPEKPRYGLRLRGIQALEGWSRQQW